MDRELKNSLETHFHAAWLFLRFFYITMSPDRYMGARNNARNISRQSSLNSNTSASTDQEGRDLIIWDIAIACLALSVKLIVFLALYFKLLLIRVMGLSSSSLDFLHPLLPVYACGYLALALRRLSYEDLEVSSFLTIHVF